MYVGSLLWLLCVVSCAVTLFAEVNGQQTVELTTPSGAARGIRLSSGDHSYIDKFFKIPFARPPIGDLRFRPPQRHQAWEGVRDATQLGPQCPQLSNPWLPHSLQFTNDEDCLYLNVYTPKPPAEGGQMPVMFWVHGGGYDSGTANTYDGSVLSSKGVVVVATNYRLGALGFLSTEDAASPGNYGLLDQIRALEWVRDSISAFHGNPSDVTIFGESAGSTSVSLLVMSQAARGLFHKAIMQSGVSLTPWAVGFPRVDPDPRDQAVELARRVGCGTDDSIRMVQCLRAKDATEIVNATIHMIESAPPIPFRPVAESTFGQTHSGVLTAAPLEILENGGFPNITIIRGFNKDETATEDIDPENDGVTLDEFQNTVQSLVSRYLTRTSHAVDLDKIKTLLLEAYVTKPNITDPLELRAASAQLGTDFRFVAPTLQELKLMTKFPVQPQYLYRFSYRSDNRLTPEWTGVNHGDELRYVFGMPISNVTWMPSFVSAWTDEDLQISGNMVTMWTNFAKYGDPTPTGFPGVQWLSWTPDGPFFLDIANPSHTRNDDVISGDIYTLWADTIPRILRGESVLVG